MKLDIRAMAFGLGILWGAAVLVMGLANLIWTGYGTEFLKLLSSVYPGYKASGSVGDLFAGVLYALVDGALFGLILSWLYNRFQRPSVVKDSKREAGVHYAPIEPQP